MKEEVITIETLKSGWLTYLRSLTDLSKADIVVLQAAKHKLRIKQVIYNRLFAYYSDEMDFTHCISKGSKIIVDKRQWQS